MLYIYWLKHNRIIENRKDFKIESIIDIGIYSSKEKALTKVQKYKTLPGFQDYPDGFEIEKVQIKYNPKLKKKIINHTVYELWNEYEVIDKNGNYDFDVLNVIAFCSSMDWAKKILEKEKKNPKFASHPEGFEIAERIIDQDGWIEGFTSN